MSEAAFGYTVFCDDIRNEVGGKVTYVGAYLSNLLVHSEYPVTLPKFCFAITIYEPHDDLADKAELKIYLPSDPDDKPSIVGDLDFPKLEQPQDGKFRIFRAHLVFAPVILQSDGWLRVRAERKGITMKLGSLRVTKQIPATT
jgi:hypothetical protein